MTVFRDRQNYQKLNDLRVKLLESEVEGWGFFADTLPTPNQRSVEFSPSTKSKRGWVFPTANPLGFRPPFRTSRSAHHQENSAESVTSNLVIHRLIMKPCL
jgi:hypothetical protein